MGWKIGDKITVDPTDNDLVLLEHEGNARNSTFDRMKKFLLGDEVLKTTAQTIKGAINENTAQLSEIVKKLPILSLDEYESYKVAVTNGYDYAPALTQMISELPADGGTILIPNKVYGIYSNVTINKTLCLKGEGYTSVLSGTGTISTDTDTNHKLIVKDVKLVNTGTGTLLKVNKTWTSSAGWSFDISNTFFHSTGGVGGTLLDIYGARESNINKCFFTSDTTDLNTTGINLRGDNIGGAMNISIANNTFYFLKNAINGVGTATGYYLLAGIRMLNNIIFGCVTALYFKNSDYITFENGMIDWTSEPIRFSNISYIKIRNNYLFTSVASNNIIEITNDATITDERNCLDISHNYFRGQATSSASAVYVAGNSVEITDGKILDNDIQYVDTAIKLEGINNGKVKRMTIRDNIVRHAFTFIKLNSGTENCNANGNITGAEVQTYSIDTGVRNNIIKEENIGGRNYIKNSTFTLGNNGLDYWWFISNQAKIIDAENYKPRSKIVKINASGKTIDDIQSLNSSRVRCYTGEEFTFSVDFKVDDFSAWDNKIPFIVEFGDLNENRVQYRNITLEDLGITTMDNGKWYRGNVTVKATTEGIYSTTMRLSLFRNGTIYFREPQIEKSNISSDWTPAPEDGDIKRENVYCTTSTRPTTNLYLGRYCFDGTLNKAIHWNGTAWVDAMGTVI